MFVVTSWVKKMDLILFRGLPGCGKSTLANLLIKQVFSADDYCVVQIDGTHRFDKTQVKRAHFRYRVHTVIVENRHGSSTLYGVPPETIAQMGRRFQVVLGDNQDRPCPCGRMASLDCTGECGHGHG